MTDLLTRFVEVAPKGWKVTLETINGVPTRAMIGSEPWCPVSLGDDKSSAWALILLLDKLRTDGYNFALEHDVGDPLAIAIWKPGKYHFMKRFDGATWIEAVVKAYVEVMEK